MTRELDAPAMYGCSGDTRRLPRPRTGWTGLRARALVRRGGLAQRCATPGRWRAAGLLLLLLLAAGAPADAQVAARHIARGKVLTEADIVRGKPRVHEAPGAVGPGWVARRVIAEGESLREPAVGKPPLIRAGEAVQAVWGEGSVTLQLRGTAMGSAAAGERVLVRIDARRRFEGTATGAGVVRINQESR